MMKPATICPASGDNADSYPAKLQVAGERLLSAELGISVKLHACPHCGKAVLLRQGPAGNFWLQIPRHTVKEA